MADSSPGLASIIAGNDPQSANILQAVHDEQARNYVQDPSNWQGGGLLGGLARVLASTAMPNNTGLVGQIAQNRVAAQPDLAKLMASDDPYKAAASNPGGYNPIALAQLLSGTPAQAAEARQGFANAQILGQNAAGYASRAPIGTQPGAGISTPPTKNIAPGPLTMTNGPATSGRYPVAQPAAPAAAAQMPTVDPVIAASGMAPQQRQAMLQNPAMRAQILARLRALQGGGGQQQQQPGAAGALRPPT